VQQPTPVIERQPYQSPAPKHGGRSDADRDRVRRMIAGVVTNSGRSAQGDTSVASTTKNPQPGRQLLGGDETLGTPLGASPGGGTSGAPVAGGGGGAAPALVVARRTPVPARLISGGGVRDRSRSVMR